MTIPPYCSFCLDACADPEDPDGQADCRQCGGSFAWRQREAYYRAYADDGDAMPKFAEPSLFEEPIPPPNEEQ